MAKMKIAHDERFRVKLECLRMIADLKVDKARSRLIAGFVDSYLKLNETEKSLFAAAVNDLEEPRKEGVMDLLDFASVSDLQKWLAEQE